VDYGELALILMAVAVGFFAKGMTGVGGPLLAVPVVAAFTSVEFAVAVIAIPTLVANVWLLLQTRDAANSVRRYLVPMLVAGTVGVFIGVLLLVSADNNWLSLMLALLVIAYIIWYLANPSFRLSERTAQRLAAPVGLIGGGIHGATGISAPVFATYTHSLNLPRTGFIFAVTVPFTVLGAALIVSLAAVGAYDRERLIAGLIAVIPVIIVTPIGSRVGERMSQRAFQLAVLVMLGASAAGLLWTVFT